MGKKNRVDNKDRCSTKKEQVDAEAELIMFPIVGAVMMKVASELDGGRNANIFDG